jgi:hypothetical protein
MGEVDVLIVVLIHAVLIRVDFEATLSAADQSCARIRGPGPRLGLQPRRRDNVLTAPNFQSILLYNFTWQSILSGPRP